MRRSTFVLLSCLFLSSARAKIPITLQGQLGGESQAVAVSPDGALAYLGVGPRVVTLDLSKPGNIRELGKSPVLPEVVEDIAVAGNYAFVADGIAGLYVLDVSDSATPAVVGRYEIPVEPPWLRDSRGFHVGLSGKQAYFCNGDGGLHVLDVSNPAKPTCITTLQDVHAHDVEVVDGYAYVGTSNQGLLVLDVSDPANPRTASRFEASYYFPEIEVSDGYVYATGEGDAPDYAWGLFVIDARDPLKPVLAGCCDLDHPGELAIAGKIAYVANGWKGVEFIRITNPAVPAHIGGYRTSGFAVAIAATAGNIYVSASHSGLEIVDVSNPALPAPKGTYATREAAGVAVSDGYAYVVSAYTGLQVIDISDPNTPTWVSELDLHSANCMSMGKDCVWVGDNVRLTAIDVSEPLTPKMIAWCSVGSYIIMDIAVEGTRVYATAGNGLTILDGSNPAKPVILSQRELSGPTWGVCVSGRYAYVTGVGGLDILDISNPAAPIRMGRYAEEGDWPLDVAIRGDYAYLANGGFGLRVIDISDPWLPGRVREFDTQYAQSIVIQGQYAYLADLQLGLQVFDVSNPATIRHLGNYANAGFYKIAVSGSYVYAADWGGGLAVLKMGEPEPGEDSDGLGL